MNRLQKLLKNLDITVAEYKFSGPDPILVFDFLARFVEECDTQDMSEGQAFVALPRYLVKTAAIQYRAMQNGARSGGISCWPEAVQYLLGTYATPAAIRNALADLGALRQHPDEDEVAFAARVSQAVYRCGNVHDEDEKMTFFTNGLPDSIRTLIARYRESEYRYNMTFELLIQHAKDEADAYRARHQ